MDLKALHAELQFRTSRSSGSGGQHVNKVETRIELLFSVKESQFLSNNEKERLLELLANRINKEGVLLIASGNYRSQLRNKKAAIEKFDELLREALKPRKKRKPVKKLTADPGKRLEAKKRHSEKKALRGKVFQ